MTIPRALLYRKIIVGAGYTMFFFFCFGMMVYFTFPYDRLRDYIIAQVEQPLDAAGVGRPTGYELTIADLGPSWGTGVTATGVHVRKLSTTPDAHPLDITLDELTVRINPFAKLLGRNSVAFDAELAGGKIDGAYSESETTTSLEMDIDEVNLRMLGVIGSTVGIPIGGLLTGSINMDVSTTPDDTNGELDLTVQDLTIGNNKAKLKLPGMMDGLTIERISAGDLTLQIEVEKGVGKITKLSAHGKDCELDASGQIRPARSVRDSNIDTLLKIKFMPAYENRSERTKAIFFMLKANPLLQAAQASGGAIQFRFRGPLSGPMIPRPAGTERI